MLAEFLLVLALSGSRPGAHCVATCPFPEKLLPYRIHDRKTGKLTRSREALEEFYRCVGVPKSERSKYRVDHIFPLACGGPDVPENMCLQTVVDSSAKDRWERKRISCGDPEWDLR